jgi:IS30 family transposase
MKHLSGSDRNQIELLVNQGYSKRAIARVLQRNFESIREEIKRNSVK